MNKLKVNFKENKQYTIEDWNHGKVFIDLPTGDFIFNKKEKAFKKYICDDGGLNKCISIFLILEQLSQHSDFKNTFLMGEDIDFNNKVKILWKSVFSFKFNSKDKENINNLYKSFESIKFIVSNQLLEHIVENAYRYNWVYEESKVNLILDKVTIEFNKDNKKLIKKVKFPNLVGYLYEEKVNEVIGDVGGLLSKGVNVLTGGSVSALNKLFKKEKVTIVKINAKDLIEKYDILPVNERLSLFKNYLDQNTNYKDLSKDLIGSLTNIENFKSSNKLNIEDIHNYNYLLNKIPRLIESIDLIKDKKDIVIKNQIETMLELAKKIENEINDNLKHSLTVDTRVLKEKAKKL